MSILSTKTIIFRCNYIVRLPIRSFGVSPLKSINKESLIASISSPLNAKIVKKRHIKDHPGEQNTDSRWSVTAYNLSEELKIHNINKLLENFDDYDFNHIDQDIQNEAVMLSLKLKKNDTSYERPLNDVFLFREGSIVFWGVPYDEQRRFVYRLSPLKINPLSQELIQEEKEFLNYTFTNDKSRLVRDLIKLSSKQDVQLRHLDQFAFSHAMALSCKLGVWECMLDSYIESVDWITENMKTGKKLSLTRDQVFKKTGEIYELKHMINLSSDLLDLPDVYWDRHNQEIVYSSMISFLNIKKRTAVMNEKLNHCCELMNLLANHMNDKHHLRLEWMIIVLITVEVLFEIVSIYSSK